MNPIALTAAQGFRGGVGCGTKVIARRYRRIAAVVSAASSYLQRRRWFREMVVMRLIVKRPEAWITTNYECWTPERKNLDLFNAGFEKKSSRTNMDSVQWGKVFRVQK